MSWRSILGKIMTIARAKLNSAINKLDDPKARLDLAMEEYEEVIRLLEKAMVLMAAKKGQIGNYREKTGKNIVSAKNLAKGQLAKKTPQGQRIARIHLSTAAYGEQAIVEWAQIETRLETDLVGIQEDVVFCRESVKALRMRIDIDEMRVEVAEARVSAYEELTGLKDRGNSLAESLRDYEEYMEDREATAQAMADMVASGMLESVAKEVMPEPEYGRVDELMLELEKEINLAQTTELDPKEIKMYAKPITGKVR